MVESQTPQQAFNHPASFSPYRIDRGPGLALLPAIANRDNLCKFTSKLCTAGDEL